MSYTLLPPSAVVDIIEMIKATFGALSPLVLLILGLIIGYEILGIAMGVSRLITYGLRRAVGMPEYEEDEEDEEYEEDQV